MGRTFRLWPTYYTFTPRIVVASPSAASPDPQQQQALLVSPPRIDAQEGTSPVQAQQGFQQNGALPDDAVAATEQQAAAASAATSARPSTGTIPAHHSSASSSFSTGRNFSSTSSFKFLDDFLDSSRDRSDKRADFSRGSAPPARPSFREQELAEERRQGEEREAEDQREREYWRMNTQQQQQLQQEQAAMQQMDRRTAVDAHSTNGFLSESNMPMRKESAPEISIVSPTAQKPAGFSSPPASSCSSSASSSSTSSLTPTQQAAAEIRLSMAMAAGGEDGEEIPMVMLGPSTHLLVDHPHTARQEQPRTFIQKISTIAAQKKPLIGGILLVLIGLAIAAVPVAFILISEFKGAGGEAIPEGKGPYLENLF